MQYTKELRGDEARKALKKGIDRVFDPVAVTMGAKGRNTVYREFGLPKPTNDGASIARRVFPEDKFESMGADLIKQVSEETVRAAGDGTTTATVLAHALIEEGMKEIEKGESPVEIRDELESAKDVIVRHIKQMAKPVISNKDILNIAKISVEDNELAHIVSDAVDEAGEYGAVLVEEGSSYKIEKEKVQGYHWNRGYVSPYMITNSEKNEAILEDCAVIVTDRYLNLNKDLVQTITEIMKNGAKSALIIADKVEGELLQTLIVNKMKGIFTTVAVTRPSTDEELEDIALITKSVAVMKDSGIKEINWGHVGKAKRVIVGKDKITIITEDNVDVTKRVEDIKKQIKDKKDKNEKSDILIERLAKLSDGMVRIRVGAKTEAERKHKKDKMDDAVSAAKAAKDEGIVAGAGACLNEIADKMNGIVAKALRTPYQQILKNAGIEEDGKYYDVRTGEEVSDLIAEGIIDPAKVERCAVENAISLAKTFLTIESVIADFTVSEEKDK